jgi:hypothetical protein
LFLKQLTPVPVFVFLQQLREVMSAVNHRLVFGELMVLVTAESPHHFNNVISLHFNRFCIFLQKRLKYSYINSTIIPMRKFVFLLLLSLLFPVIGCSKVPTGLGTLYPVTITVTNKGTPLEGVLVSLVDKEPQTPRGCSALTNSAGVAKITTNLGSYTGNGVVAGNYRVALFKIVTLPQELQGGDEELTLPENKRKEREKQRSEFLENNRIIPPLLESRTSSPIELTVEKKSTVLTIDLSQF